MEAPLFIENNIQIAASAAKVWDALTNPSETKKYMFGCETVSDWAIGSPLLWQAEYEGQLMVFVKGHVLAIIPNKLLVYSVFDPNSTMDDIPENYLNVTYKLTETNGATLLTVTQGDYSTVAEGARRFEESSNGGEGWNPILVLIKSQVEAG
jgi:uncharacterized protein YndB with AHSA1/START domain